MTEAEFLNGGRPVKKTQTIYISGPMTGIPDLNFPEFCKAEIEANERGFLVVNPARMNEGVTDWAACLRNDVRALLGCDAILMLEGWRDSKGATLEHHVASQLGMTVLQRDFMPLEESIAEEADRLVSIDRQGAYGHPADDLTRTGRFWGATLGIPDVPARLVALCMVGLKLSRETHKPKRDNRVDGIGYLKCADLILAREAEEARK